MLGAVALTVIMVGVGLVIMIPVGTRLLLWADRIKEANGRYGDKTFSE